jgi:phosphoribosylamine---glycine ligase
MKVLVIGGGGREHTIVWKLKQSPLVNEIYCAPGNAGIAKDAECVDIDVMDIKGLLKFATKKKIDLTVVGPEAPLVAGIVDEFEKNNVPVFGPSARAAEMEGSKAYTKYILDKYNIPTAQFKVFTDYAQAKHFVKSSDGPLVIKADGLAAGKGVLMCQNQEEALDSLRLVMETKAFGNAGEKVVIEEWMIGQELSVLALSDGENLAYMIPSQDHKRIFDADQGPNTGGMGAYAPTPILDPGLMERIKKEIMEPTIKGLALEDRPYKGILYAGLMITAEGPKVVEYNCRFGDPETQVVLPLAKSDLFEGMMAAKDGKLAGFKWENHDAAAVCVVIASGGYPGSYEKGKQIIGLDGPFEDGVTVFHAGTKLTDGKVVTAGGRVLGVTAIDDDIEKAIAKVYRGVGKITFDGAYYRKDIATKALI